MSGFESYFYSSSAGWDMNIHAGSSNNVEYAGGLTLQDSSYSYFPFLDYSLDKYDDIPIGEHPEFTDALGPVNFQGPAVGVEAVQPPLQYTQDQFAPQFDFQSVGLAPYQLVQTQSIQPTLTQSAQLGHPQPVAPPHMGGQDQNAKPSSVRKHPRKDYVLTTPPIRKRRAPKGTPEFCRFDGCSMWTLGRGKELSRHRESHLPPGSIGSKCPVCHKLYRRSPECGRHLKKCDRALWKKIRNNKGTLDSWGIKVGGDPITPRLVDGDYAALPQNELKAYKVGSSSAVLE